MINWNLLVLLLRKHYGKSLSAIARELDLSGVHLRRIARGEVAEPRFNSGIRLLDLAYDELPPDELKRVLN